MQKVPVLPVTLFLLCKKKSYFFTSIFIILINVFLNQFKTHLAFLCLCDRFLHHLLNKKKNVGMLAFFLLLKETHTKEHT